MRAKLGYYKLFRADWWIGNAQDCVENIISSIAPLAAVAMLCATGLVVCYYAR